MKGRRRLPISVFFSPFPLLPLATLRSAPLRSAPTAGRPVCHRSRPAARWRPMSGWLVGCPTGLILGHEGPFGKRFSRRARQRQADDASAGPARPLVRTYLSLPPAHLLTIAPSRSRSDSKFASPRVPFSSAAGRDDGGDRAAVAGCTAYL